MLRHRMPPRKLRVLYVEAPSGVRDDVAAALARRRFHVELASSRDEAATALAAAAFDVVVVDAALRGGNPLRWLRARPGIVDMVPVVLLCGFDADRQVHAGYRLGAKLCLQRPIRGDVLGAHLEALLAPSGSHSFRLGEIAFDPSRKVMTIPGKGEVRLPPQELQLLISLARDFGRPVGHEHLISDLWPSDKQPSSRNSLQVVVKRLRVLLGPSAWMLRAVRDRGYILSVDGERKRR